MNQIVRMGIEQVNDLFLALPEPVGLDSESVHHRDTVCSAFAGDHAFEQILVHIFTHDCFILSISIFPSISPPETFFVPVL